MSIGAKIVFMRADAGAADPFDIVKRCAKTDRLDDWRRARLEAMRRGVVSNRIARDLADHLAPAIEGRQFLEPFALAVKNTDPGRPVDLMAGKNIEVRVKVANINVEMDGALRTIDQHRNAAGVSDANDLLQRRHCAEHIRHMGDRDDLRPIRQHAFEAFERQRSVVGDLDPFHHRAFAFAMEMPRHNIRMVLHDGQDDFIAFMDMVETETRRHEIDRLGRVTREDDLLMRRSIQETPHTLARRLVTFRRGISEIMQAAVHVGIFMLIGLAQPIEHLPRLLCRGGVIEIDKRLAIRTLGKDRKIRPESLDVIGRYDFLGDGHEMLPARTASQPRALPRSTSRNASSATRSIASKPKASSNIASASVSGMPRARK